MFSLSSGGDSKMSLGNMLRVFVTQQWKNPQHSHEVKWYFEREIIKIKTKHSSVDILECSASSFLVQLMELIYTQNLRKALLYISEPLCFAPLFVSTLRAQYHRYSNLCPPGMQVPYSDHAKLKAGTHLIWKYSFLNQSKCLIY